MEPADTTDEAPHVVTLAPAPQPRVVPSGDTAGQAPGGSVSPSATPVAEASATPSAPHQPVASGAGSVAEQVAVHDVQAVPKAEAALPGAAAQAAVDPAAAKARLVLENMRLQKWREMLANWDTWSSKKASHIKSRCRKGIPDAFRALVWPLLVHSGRRKAANRSLYSQLLDAPVVEAQERVMGEIERDVSRTYPRMQLFRTRGGMGQGALLRVLRAYALFNPQVGYCQGMSFITAFFLSYMGEEDTFWMILTLCEYEPHRLADIFAPGLPLVNLLQYQLAGLVRQYLPRLAAHFELHGIHPTMYAAHWVLTVFSYSFPFSITARIWDAFLVEGWKVVFRVALAVLQHRQAELLTLDMEGLLMRFPTLHEGLEADALLQAAFKFSFRRRQLRALRAEFEAENGPVVSPVQRMQSFEARRAAVAKAATAASDRPTDGLQSPQDVAAAAAAAAPSGTPVLVMGGGGVTVEHTTDWTATTAPSRAGVASSPASPRPSTPGRARSASAAPVTGRGGGFMRGVMRSFSGTRGAGGLAPGPGDPGDVGSTRSIAPGDLDAVLVPGSPVRTQSGSALVPAPPAPAPEGAPASRSRAASGSEDLAPLHRPRSASSAPPQRPALTSVLGRRE